MVLFSTTFYLPIATTFFDIAHNNKLQQRNLQMQNNYTNIQIGHGLAATKNKKKGKFPSLYKFRIIGS